jgi:hypothetical protein
MLSLILANLLEDRDVSGLRRVVSGFGCVRIQDTKDKKGSEGRVGQSGLRLGGLKGGEQDLEALLKLTALFREWDIPAELHNRRAVILVAVYSARRKKGNGLSSLYGS